MKSKLFLFAFLAITLSVALVTASTPAPALELTTVSVPAAVHGQDITIRLNLTDKSASVDYSQLVWSDTTVSPGTIKQLPSLTTIKGGETKEVAFVASIPKYAQDTATLQVKVKNTATGTPIILSVPIVITSAPVLTITKTQELTVKQNGTLTITNAGNVALNNIDLSVPAVSTNKITFSADNFALVPGASKTVDILGKDLLVGDSFGNNDLIVTAQDTTQKVATATTTFTLAKTFCSNGAQADNLTIDRVKIESTGKKSKWMPLDEITVTVKTRNRGTSSVNDAVVELGLFDSTGKDVTSDLDFKNTDSERISIGRISKSSDETVTFEFQVPGDMEAGDYRLAVKAYSDDVGESKLCADTSSDLDSNFYQLVTLDRESETGKFIAFNKMSFTPNQASCGDSVTLTTNVYNIGDEDQDRIKVRLVNPELKIDAFQELRNGLDIGDSSLVTLSFAIPPTAIDKTYDLQLTALYDYRSGDYKENLDSPVVLPYKVFGCGPARNVSGDALSLNSVVTSDPKPGQQFTVKSTIRNIGTQPITVILNAKGYELWAKLDKLSDRLVQLASGETKEVTTTFTVNTDASGEKSFTLEANTGDRIQTQETTLSLPKASNSFDAFTGNKLAWILGIVNVVLIILVIVVAIKIAQR